MPKNPNIALWVVNANYPIHSQDDWVALATAELERAAEQGMDMLVIPEHISEIWMNYAPDFPSETVEAEWVMDQAAQIIPRLQNAVRQTNVALVAGSSLYRDESTGKKFNRAWALFPDRAPAYHDKCVMTPAEKDSEGYHFALGETLTVFEWRGWRWSLLICLDVEMPALAHILSAQDIDMLIVPSQTSRPSGYNRVFNCARARAVELMAAVCVVGNTGGDSEYGLARGPYNGAAAVFIPCEEPLGSTGIFDQIPVHDKIQGVGKILYAKNIPLADIRSARRNGAEAWPGPWPADHITVKQA